MKIPFWKLKEDGRLAAAVFLRSRSLRDVFWINGCFSKKNFCFAEGNFLRRNVTFSCKKYFSIFFRILGDVFDRFFQNSIIRLQRNNLKKPNFDENIFPLNFSRFSRRSFDFCRNVLGAVAATLPLILTKLPSRCPEEKMWVFKAVLRTWTSCGQTWTKTAING